MLRIKQIHEDIIVESKMRIMLSYFLQISIQTFQERFELKESQSFNNADENYASNS